MRYVIALGGNALLRRGESPDAALQEEHVRVAARALAPVAKAHQVVLCHGNGPQIGLLARESASDENLARPFPLDALGAQTQGMIGYWLARELTANGVQAPVAVLVTQTLVDPEDAAFTRPQKFIGPSLSHAQADEIAARFGWDVARDGSGWRRVVASPEPRSVSEIPVVAHLLDVGAVVVCGGGGGVPVSVTPERRGVEAVVDKDLTAALIAVAVNADRLVVLTDVAGVMTDFGTDRARVVQRLALSQLGEHNFATGSMGPKVEACRRFVAATGRHATIGSLDDTEAVLAGRAGTTVVPGD